MKEQIFIVLILLFLAGLVIGQARCPTDIDCSQYKDSRGRPLVCNELTGMCVEQQYTTDTCVQDPSLCTGDEVCLVLATAGRGVCVSLDDIWGDCREDCRTHPDVCNYAGGEICRSGDGNCIRSSYSNINCGLIGCPCDDQTCVNTLCVRDVPTTSTIIPTTVPTTIATTVTSTVRTTTTRTTVETTEKTTIETTERTTVKTTIVSTIPTTILNKPTTTIQTTFPTTVGTTNQPTTTPTIQTTQTSLETSTPTTISCSGCQVEGRCLPFGIRISNKFCDIDSSMKEQVADGQACQNSYECISNFCASSICENIHQEISENKGLLSSILAFLKKIFPFF